MDVNLWTAVGIIAASLTSFGFAPQVIKMWRSRSVADVSVLTFWQYAIGIGLWTAYGISIGDVVFTIANIVSLLTLWAALTLYYRSRVSALENAVLNAARHAVELGVDPLELMRRQSQVLARSVAETGGDVREITGQIFAGSVRAAHVAGLDLRSAIRSSAEGITAGVLRGASSAGLRPRVAAAEAVRNTMTSASELVIAEDFEAADAAAEGIFSAAGRLPDRQGDAVRSYLEQSL